MADQFEEVLVIAHHLDAGGKEYMLRVTSAADRECAMVEARDYVHSEWNEPHRFTLIRRIIQNVETETITAEQAKAAT